jgi:hypothetical protein
MENDPVGKAAKPHAEHQAGPDQGIFQQGFHAIKTTRRHKVHFMARE